jgi:hypothetical protein
MREALSETSWPTNLATNHTHVLKLEKNLYGLKDDGLTWFKNLKKGLFQCGFKQSEVDPCLFVKGKLILITYVDDCVTLCPTVRQNRSMTL